MNGILPPLFVAACRLPRVLAYAASATVRSRRAFLAAGAVVFAGLVLAFAPAKAQQPMPWAAERWVATWGAALAGPPTTSGPQAYENQTLRLVVHTSIGGSMARVRLSNELGTAPLRIGSAHIAVCQSGSATVPGTDRTLKFGGSETVTIAAGAQVLSDPVELAVPALSGLAVSLYLPGRVQAITDHGAARQAGYLSLQGNFTDSATLPVEHTLTSWPFLTEVDVNRPDAAAVVILGDSITDGPVTKAEGERSWPDHVALRLQTTRDLWKSARGGHSALPGMNSRLGVVDRSYGGHRLLRGAGDKGLFGQAALARFDRDVLATAGVRHLVVVTGISDIGLPGTGAVPVTDRVSAQDLIDGYRQLIARAHDKGIAVYGATLAPFEGAIIPGFYTAEKEAVRDAVNNWIRGSGEFDAVIDLDHAVRDPANPSRILPAYDSGDHLHLNDRGLQEMANVAALELFRSMTPEREGRRK
jgi:lysophospholipase L1-like esterase